MAKASTGERVTRDQLAKAVEGFKCEVRGWENAEHAGHRIALAVIAQAFNQSESKILCECSLARKTYRPADICLVDVEVGIHVFEVKGVELDQIEAVEGGGQITIRYNNGPRSRNPIHQVRRAMFDIKDATRRAFEGEVRIDFNYWVVFPFVSLSAWLQKFGDRTYRPQEFLFSDDLIPAQLARRLRASNRVVGDRPIEMQPLEQLQCVWHAFGDTSVLYWKSEERQPRTIRQGTLGAIFDKAAEAYKNLSPEQQKLSEANWIQGPRVVRGVAGSGKTIVLANNLARNLERRTIPPMEGLFDAPKPEPRLLAVCFNRSLAPLIRTKIEIAYRQRTGMSIPAGTIDTLSFNKLMFSLARQGLWRYMSNKGRDPIVLAKQYLAQLAAARLQNPQRVQTLLYDAIYVDEGQDLIEEEFRLLKELCRIPEGGEPKLYIFYDDAQNLYGHERPIWAKLGLNVQGGRSHVMTECHRNTRPIVEMALNVLYGTCAPLRAKAAPTKKYASLSQLEAGGLITNDDGFWRVKFARRDGQPPQLTVAASRAGELELVVSRLRWLIEDQDVRPSDILVLAYERDRVRQLASAIQAARIRGVVAVNNSLENKDAALCQPGKIAVSTIASAKGYDAYCVLLASANEFRNELKDRASFYVGCTRAIEYLEVFAYEKKALASEMAAVLERLM